MDLGRFVVRYALHANQSLAVHHQDLFRGPRDVADSGSRDPSTHLTLTGPAVRRGHHTALEFGAALAHRRRAQ